jgi:hypothetical protein
LKPLEQNEMQEINQNLKVIGIILEHQDPKYNPFSALPANRVEKALQLLEEYSEEIQP